MYPSLECSLRPATFLESWCWTAILICIFVLAVLSKRKTDLENSLKIKSPQQANPGKLLRNAAVYAINIYYIYTLYIVYMYYMYNIYLYYLLHTMYLKYKIYYPYNIYWDSLETALYLRESWLYWLIHNDFNACLNPHNNIFKYYIYI